MFCLLGLAGKGINDQSTGDTLVRADTLPQAPAQRCAGALVPPQNSSLTSECSLWQRNLPPWLLPCSKCCLYLYGKTLKGKISFLWICAETQIFQGMCQCQWHFPKEEISVSRGSSSSEQESQTGKAVVKILTWKVRWWWGRGLQIIPSYLIHN